jgi:hypothetical protein
MTISAEWDGEEFNKIKEQAICKLGELFADLRLVPYDLALQFRNYPDALLCHYQARWRHQQVVDSNPAFLLKHTKSKNG